MTPTPPKWWRRLRSSFPPFASCGKGGCWSICPESCRLAAKAREENPEASLSELAAMMEPPITKPAMNHRMKKIVSLAAEENK